MVKFEIGNILKVPQIVKIPEWVWYTALHLVILKYLVSNISESKPFSSMFWGSFDRKYFKLPKFIQKNYPNSRMPRIFMDSVDKSAFYIGIHTYVFSRNKFI